MYIPYYLWSNPACIGIIVLCIATPVSLDCYAYKGSIIDISLDPGSRLALASTICLRSLRFAPTPFSIIRYVFRLVGPYTLRCIVPLRKKSGRQLSNSREDHLHTTVHLLLAASSKARSD